MAASTRSSTLPLPSVCLLYPPKPHPSFILNEHPAHPRDARKAVRIRPSPASNAARTWPSCASPLTPNGIAG
jgi:hypothetical protein